jgi:hypothetical protein
MPKLNALVTALVLGALVTAAPAPASTGAARPAGSTHAVKAAKKKRRRHHARKPQSACQKLRGHDYAPSRSLKLVARRANSIETDLAACEMPRGDVRYHAIQVDAGDTRSDFTVHSVAGRWALISTESSSPYGADSRTWVVDIAGGRILYRITDWRCTISPEPCDPEPPRVVKGHVDRIGKSVLAFSADGTTTIAGFGTDGHRKTFDSGPSGELLASTLQLRANVASWLHGGEERGGVLP